MPAQKAMKIMRKIISVQQTFLFIGLCAVPPGLCIVYIRKKARNHYIKQIIMK